MTVKKTESATNKKLSICVGNYNLTSSIKITLTCQDSANNVWSWMHYFLLRERVLGINYFQIRSQINFFSLLSHSYLVSFSVFSVEYIHFWLSWLSPGFLLLIFVRINTYFLPPHLNTLFETKSLKNLNYFQGLIDWISGR